MSSTPQLDGAIALLEEEISALGTPASPASGENASSTWWLLRAKSTGLSLLKALRQKGLTDPVAADSYRKDLRIKLVAAGEPGKPNENSKP